MLDLGIAITRRPEDYGRLFVDVRGLEIGVGFPDFDARLVGLEEAYPYVILRYLLAQHYDLIAATQLGRAAAQPINGQLIALAVDRRGDDRIERHIVVAHLDEGLVAQTQLVQIDAAYIVFMIEFGCKGIKCQMSCI